MVEGKKVRKSTKKDLSILFLLSLKKKKEKRGRGKRYYLGWKTLSRERRKGEKEGGRRPF